MYRKTLLAILALILPAAWAAGKNVDLVTLPKRHTVQLTIYNSEDITLVKETRYITFKTGANKLQFSWANTLIDPTSIELRPLEHAGEIEVVATVFPGQKPQHLIWSVESKFEGQAKVQVSYFTSGLTWQMDYVGVCDPAEESMLLRGYVRVFNNSGEEYDNAEVRLIVGKINLVEKIADLARRYGQPVPQPGTADYLALRREAAKRSFDQAAKAAEGDGIAKAPKGIVKEGVSEYFMFTVQGSETVPNLWSKRMRAVKAESVAFEIVHRLREHQYGPGVRRVFVFTNDAAHKLGDCPLPDGMFRVFRDNGRDGLAFLAAQRVHYVPIKAKAEINVGVDNLVVYTRRKASTRRLNFTFHRRPAPDGREYVVGWDEQQKWIDEIRNHRDKPLKLELRRVHAGDVDFTSEHPTGTFDHQTIEATFTVPAGGTKDYPHTVVTHHGVNAKQSRVQILK